MFTKEQQDRAIQAAQEKQLIAEGVEAIYQAYPTILRCDANTHGIIRLTREFMDESTIPDVESFRNLLALNPDVINELVIRDTSRIKNQYIDSYIELLAAHSRQDMYTLQSERSRLSHLSVDQVRLKLEELRRRQKMASTSVNDLKALVADARRVVTEFPGWPTLPPVLWDGTKHATVDAEYLNGLARTDLFMFRKLVRLYGSQQIDHRRGLR